jgi:hypothetical protein
MKKEKILGIKAQAEEARSKARYGEWEKLAALDHLISLIDYALQLKTEELEPIEIASIYIRMGQMAALAGIAKF